VFWARSFNHCAK